MKYLLLVVFGFLFTASSPAQTKMTNNDDIKLIPAKTDGFMLQDGKLMMMKGPLSTEVKNDITLKNGTIITKEGVIKTKDGKTISLKNGDWILKDGTIRNAVRKKKSVKAH